MLGFLTTESKNPIVHVNTLFHDSWADVCKLSAQAEESMTQQERLEVRVRIAQHLNLEFLLEFSPYFDCTAEDRGNVPAWRSKKALQEAMGTVAPWVAVWNRVVRKMVSFDTVWLQASHRIMQSAAARKLSTYTNSITRISLVQVRLKLRHLTDGAESPLKEVFLMATNDSPWMDIMAFEGWINQSGYPTAICAWLSKQMSRIAMEVRN